jgi:hypothetical protein
MLVLVPQQVIIEYNYYVASIILDGWAKVDINNMFDFYLEKDIEGKYHTKRYMLS